MTVLAFSSSKHFAKTALLPNHKYFLSSTSVNYCQSHDLDIPISYADTPSLCTHTHALTQREHIYIYISFCDFESLRFSMQNKPLKHTHTLQQPFDVAISRLPKN